MTTHHTPRCRRLVDRLSRFIDDDLNEKQRRAVREHLRRCPCCSDFVEDLRRTVALCRDARQTGLPAAMRARALAGVRRLLASPGSCRS